MDDAKLDIMSDSKIKLRLENVTLPPSHVDSANFDVSCWRDTELNVTIKDLLLEAHAQTIKCLTEFMDDQKSEDNMKPIVFEVRWKLCSMSRGDSSLKDYENPILGEENFRYSI